MMTDLGHYVSYSYLSESLLNQSRSCGISKQSFAEELVITKLDIQENRLEGLTAVVWPISR